MFRLTRFPPLITVLLPYGSLRTPVVILILIAFLILAAPCSLLMGIAIFCLIDASEVLIRGAYERVFGHPATNDLRIIALSVVVGLILAILCSTYAHHLLRR